VWYNLIVAQWCAKSRGLKLRIENSRLNALAENIANDGDELEVFVAQIKSEDNIQNVLSHLEHMETTIKYLRNALRETLET